MKYTYDKNSKFYNPNWITDNFGKEEVDAMLAEVNQIEEKVKKQSKKIVAIVFGSLGASLVLAGILLLIFLL